MTSLALFVAFFLFPIVHTRWGDAFMLAKGIAFPDPALRITHSWQAPLDVFLHSQLWLRFHAQVGWADAMPVYQLLSPVAGGIYLLVVLALSRRWHVGAGLAHLWTVDDAGADAAFFRLCGKLQFCSRWCSSLSLAGYRRGARATHLVAGGRRTGAYHRNPPEHGCAGAEPALPGLGRLAKGNHGSSPDADAAIDGGVPRGNQSFARVVVQIALPMLLVGGATFLWMEASGHGLYALLNTDRPGGGDARWFVPLFATTTRWEHFTMFSWLHLREWLNMQLLVAPVVLPGLAVTGFALWRQRDAHRKDLANLPGWATVNFLLSAAVLYLLFTFVWNPDYGGQRDWDLFSLAALPTTLLFVALLPRTLPWRRYLWAGVAPLIVLQAWHTLAWIYQNTLPWQWP